MREHWNGVPYDGTQSGGRPFDNELYDGAEWDGEISYAMPWDGERTNNTAFEDLPRGKLQNGKSNRRLVDEIIDVYAEAGSETDPLGMYTGNPHGSVSLADARPTDGCAEGKRYIKPRRVPEKPVQDADDL